MQTRFDQNLANLQDTTVAIYDQGVPDEDGTASIVLEFSNGTKLKAFYWRVISNGKAEFSSFDHMKKYGLPEVIDAKNQLIKVLSNKKCLSILFNKETGDFLVQFLDNMKIQIFNFTGYEIWEISFPDGTGEYSNYALTD